MSEAREIVAVNPDRNSSEADKLWVKSQGLVGRNLVNPLSAFCGRQMDRTQDQPEEFLIKVLGMITSGKMRGSLEKPITDDDAIKFDDVLKKKTLDIKFNKETKKIVESLIASLFEQRKQNKSLINQNKFIELRLDLISAVTKSYKDQAIFLEAGAMFESYNKNLAELKK